MEEMEVAGNRMKKRKMKREQEQEGRSSYL